MLQWFRDELWRDGLSWEIQEYTHSGVLVTTWVCPACPECWLCFETRGGMLDLVQASIPREDNAWSVRLSVAVIRAICMYRLDVET